MLRVPRFYLSHEYHEVIVLEKYFLNPQDNCIIPVIDKYLQSGYLEYIALGWIVTTPEQDNQMTLDDLFV